MTVAPSNARAIASQWRAVHKLKGAPTRIETVGAHQRCIWADSRGRDVIEEYTIMGMGHGMPLDTGRCGAVGPYMLDADISSTERLAHLWGLAPAAGWSEKTARQDLPKLPMVTTPLLNYREAPRRSGPRPSGIQTGGVRKVIEDALRTAGLMA